MRQKQQQRKNNNQNENFQEPLFVYWFSFAVISIAESTLFFASMDKKNIIKQKALQLKKNCYETTRQNKTNKKK